MAILNKKQILERINNSNIEFDPVLDAFKIQPNSVDLRLGWSFYIPKIWKYEARGRVALVADYLNLQDVPENFQIIKLKPGQYFEILPNEFVIISTLERISLNADDLTAVLYGRSSALRRGLSIGSGTVAPHYKGCLTIPLTNNSGHIIRLYPGERLCQLEFNLLSLPLTGEEASKHGLQDAKYTDSTPYGLEARSDSQEEIEFIKAGQVDQLKDKFKI